MKAITFKVSRPDGNYGLHKIAETTFELGLGPCGRVVTNLSYTIAEGLLTVVQVSRLPEDVEKPPVDYSLKARLDADRKARYRTQIAPKVHTVTVGMLWWKREVEVHSLSLENAPGTLTDSERAELEAAFKAQGDAIDRWYKAHEIKKFVYKISDVHGRIVTTE
ncbi:hypothetical protein PssvBMR2_gp10 [Pseudomonas phage MR2]|uniref:Uncharacterized protein n=1 Tax=Pseudomonas phage MR2 TaxID=2711170 RepID=A0A6M3TA67_9CAUD|nr:hypothetical protein PssvBMR2_gp10 [Pseudomonas phage MR2]